MKQLYFSTPVNGNAIDRLQTQQDPGKAGIETSGCVGGSPGGARSCTGDRRLKGLIHFSHDFKNLCVLLIRQKSDKIRLELLLSKR